MKEIIFNSDNLNSDEIDEIVTRTKALIINSKNEIMLGYGDLTYQFPGGHLKIGETSNECLKRELKEETGMDIDTSNLKPFIKMSHYTRNYRNSGKNRQNDIYFYYIRTDEQYNMKNTNLDEFERLSNFQIKLISLDKVEQILKDSIPDNPINEVIVGEMLIVLDYYKENLAIK